MKTCPEKPEELAGQPLGMYHCPECGMMVVAGVPHPVSDGVVCLACGANGSGPSDPNCPHCNFKNYVPPPMPEVGEEEPF